MLVFHDVLMVKLRKHYNVALEISNSGKDVFSILFKSNIFGSMDLASFPILTVVYIS